MQIIIEKVFSVCEMNIISFYILPIHFRYKKNVSIPISNEHVTNR